MVFYLMYKQGNRENCSFWLINRLNTLLKATGFHFRVNNRAYKPLYLFDSHLFIAIAKMLRSVGREILICEKQEHLVAC